MIYCRTLSACLDLFDYRRALEWTAAIQEYGETTGVAGFPGDCLTHRVAVLIVHGAWAEGEREAETACEQCNTFDLGHTGMATYEIGEIKLRRGDLAAAREAFRRAHELGMVPQPGIALLHLARGEVAAAMASIRGALAEIASDRLGRAKLLPAQVEVALAAGDVETARMAAAELGEIAEAFRSAALHAAAECARGAVQLADGDPAIAVRSLRRGAQLWREIEAPHEVARARLLLAQALHASGDREACLLELQAAKSAFERLGAVLDAQRAARFAEKLGQLT